jgi:hypothetical protein
MLDTLAQIPVIDRSTEVGAETVKGGFLWAVKFNLPKPAEQDGYIIQKIVQEQSGKFLELVKSDDGKEKVKESEGFKQVTYWEAWEVKKGQTSPWQQQSVAAYAYEIGKISITSAKYQVPMNDIFFKNFKWGSKGTYKITGMAGFYHETVLGGFTIGNPDTGAGGLLSTTNEPNFWTSTAGLYRELAFHFDFQRGLNELIGNIRPNPPRAREVDFRPIFKDLGLNYGAAYNAALNAYKRSTAAI